MFEIPQTLQVFCIKVTMPCIKYPTNKKTLFGRSLPNLFTHPRVFVIWVGFEVFGPCLGISHPTHPHLGGISPKKTFLLGAPLKPKYKLHHKSSVQAAGYSSLHLCLAYRPLGGCHCGQISFILLFKHIKMFTFTLCSFFFQFRLAIQAQSHPTCPSTKPAHP